MAALRGHPQEIKGMEFIGQMTIETAWRAHPGAPAVFAKHHLPACDGCAVRHEETLAEAASAYGIDLQQWLGELNNLYQG
jgi:hypothetical protein